MILHCYVLCMFHLDFEEKVTKERNIPKKNKNSEVEKETGKIMAAPLPTPPQIAQTKKLKTGINSRFSQRVNTCDPLRFAYG